eukprot:s4513_g1.t1
MMEPPRQVVECFMNARATVAECFNVLEKYTKHLAVCRFFEKLAMFVLAVGAYFSVRASDYPARWMTEYKVLVHKQCMLIWKLRLPLYELYELEIH